MRARGDTIGFYGKRARILNERDDFRIDREKRVACSHASQPTLRWRCSFKGSEVRQAVLLDRKGVA